MIVTASLIEVGVVGTSESFISIWTALPDWAAFQSSVTAVDESIGFDPFSFAIFKP